MLNPQRILCSVSSVLNNNVKQFGKQFMLDNSDETCWTSDQGVPQWITIKLKEEEIITSISVQFQGGFVGKDCLFKGELLNGEYIEMPFYPEDINTIQTFNLDKPFKLKSMHVIFNSSTDFYGRIVVYKFCWN